LRREKPSKRSETGWLLSARKERLLERPRKLRRKN